MNILPKKRWHVRTKDNIERVRRDEAKAREDELKLQQRADLAEQEARTQLLRQKASSRRPIDDGPSSSSKSESNEHDSTALVSHQQGHINFFEDVEKGIVKHGTNKEHEIEKKAEREKDEKALGILTYLGQSALDPSTANPWWSKSKKPGSSDTILMVKEGDKAQLEREKRKKDAADPLRDIEKYMAIKKKKHKADEDQRKHKHQKKMRKDSSNSIEALRQQRLEREREERLKAERLMAKLRGDKREAERVPDERTRGYNSQFHPDLARKHHHTRPQQPTKTVPTYYDHFK